MSFTLVENRCDCGHLLFRGILLDSFLEIKCKRCKKIFGSERDAAPVGRYTLLIDDRGTILDASESCLASLGYAREELRDRPLSFLDSGFSSPEQLSRWRELCAEPDSAFTFETLHRSRNGELLPMRIRFRTQALGDRRCAAAFCSTSPATEPRPVRAQRASRDLLAEISVDGAYAYVSDPLRELLGQEPLAMLGKPFFAFCEGNDAQALQYDFLLMASSGQSFHTTFALRAPDGHALPFEADFAALYGEDDALRGFRVLHEPVAAHA